MEIENKIQFLDGAMGTQLQDKGLPAGAAVQVAAVLQDCTYSVRN